MSNWTIFSNHGHVLICLAGDPEARLRDVAATVGLTERAVQKIVRDLQQSGMLTVSKHGRRNRYRIDNKKPLRHDLEAHCTIGALVKLITHESSAATTPGTAMQAEVKPGPVIAADSKQVMAATYEPNSPESSRVSKKPATPKPAKPDTPKPVKPATLGSPERKQGSLF